LSGGPWGTVKVLDMGLARLNEPDLGANAAHLTQMGTLMGTPEFIAPEQATNSRTCDIRADIYSLGCTLYFLLTGQSPFPDGTVWDKVMRHQTEAPPPVADVRATALMRYDHCETDCIVPREVQSVLARMLAKKPDDRYATPGELAEALAGIVDQLAVSLPDA